MLLRAVLGVPAPSTPQQPVGTLHGLGATRLCGDIVSPRERWTV